MATIKSYRELICWQLSVELRRGMIEVTDRPAVKRNFTFCDQVGESARSAPANIAEGFKRSNRVFMRYLDVALGSLQETENHVDEVLERKYITPDEHERFRILAKRAIRDGEQLQSYLRRVTPPARSARTSPNSANQNQPDQTRGTRRTRPTPANLTEPDET
jgi:four helix bundle protein